MGRIGSRGRQRKNDNEKDHEEDTGEGKESR